MSIIEQRFFLQARGPVPGSNEPPLSRFVNKLANVSASVALVARFEDLPGAVAEYLKKWNIEARLVVAPAPLLQDVQWPPAMTVHYRSAQAEDSSAISLAYAGIAETGSLVLCSGQETPTTLNFLPDNYICVIQQADIYPSMEDVWDLIRRQGRGMPRAINFITGPSRTADVEQTIQLGAHGPRRLHVIIVTGA